MSVSTVPRPVFREITPADMDRPDVSEFTCGAQEWATEVARQLTSGEALKYHEPAKGRFTMLFCVGSGASEQVVGFASFSVGKMVGYPQLEGNKIPCLHLAYLAVSSYHQGNSYAKMMIADLVRTAMEHKLRAIDLFVDERNTLAISFYERLGFVWHPDAPPYIEGDVAYRRMILPLDEQ